MEPAEQITELQTTVKGLQKALDDERKNSAKLKSDLDAALQVNEELTAKLDDNALQPVTAEPQQKDTVSDKTFKVGGSTYGFKKIRLSHKGALVTATEILASKDLQKELVDMSSGMIYKK